MCKNDDVFAAGKPFTGECYLPCTVHDSGRNGNGGSGYVWITSDEHALTPLLEADIDQIADTKEWLSVWSVVT
jgi:hypothetical protein